MPSRTARQIDRKKPINTSQMRTGQSSVRSKYIMGEEKSERIKYQHLSALDKQMNVVTREPYSKTE
jgi:hypothetical protein